MIEVLWLTSLAGAALFFGAGWLAARDRHPAPAVVARTPIEVPVPSPPTTERELQMLRGTLAEMQSESARQRSALDRAIGERDAVRVEVSGLQNEVLRLRKVAAPAARPPVAVRAAGQKAGDVLQKLVDGLTGSPGIRCAVVADDLGLVVASRGELGDEVAAVGALFGRAGLQAQKVLHLHKVQRVVLEDMDNATLTLRPLQMDDSVEGDLALITLASGKFKGGSDGNVA